MLYKPGSAIGMLSTLFFITSPKHSTILATMEKIISIPDKTSTGINWIAQKVRYLKKISVWEEKPWSSKN